MDGATLLAFQGPPHLLCAPPSSQAPTLTRAVGHTQLRVVPWWRCVPVTSRPHRCFPTPLCFTGNPCQTQVGLTSLRKLPCFCLPVLGGSLALGLPGSPSAPLTLSCSCDSQGGAPTGLWAQCWLAWHLTLSVSSVQCQRWAPGEWWMMGGRVVMHGWVGGWVDVWWVADGLVGWWMSGQMEGWTGDAWMVGVCTDG